MAEADAGGRPDGAPPASPTANRLRRTHPPFLGVVAAAAFFLFLAWVVGGFLLTVFAGILLAVFLHGLSSFLGHWTGLGRGWSLGVVGVTLLVVVGAGGWLLGPQVAEQIDDLWRQLSVRLEWFARILESYGWGQEIRSRLASSAGELAAGLRGAFQVAAGLIGTFAVILFLGIYIAAEPGVYTGGLVRLVPRQRRTRASAILEELGETLGWWLIGRAFSMVVVGILVWLGLSLLGVKLAVTLGLLAGLLDFIPYIGPVIAAVPAIAIAFADGPQQAAYVALLYIAVQSGESYLLTPLVQRRAVSLPPALTLSAQILGGLFFGLLGVAMATPLAAAGIVLVRRLYVEDVLGDRPP